MNTKRDEAHAWLSFLQGKDDEALGLKANPFADDPPQNRVFAACR